MRLKDEHIFGLEEKLRVLESQYMNI